MPSLPISWRSILTLSSYLYLGHPSVLSPPVFPTKTLYTHLLSQYMLHAPPILFYSIWAVDLYEWLFRKLGQVSLPKHGHGWGKYSASAPILRWFKIIKFTSLHADMETSYTHTGAVRSTYSLHQVSVPLVRYNRATGTAEVSDPISEAVRLLQQNVTVPELIIWWKC